MAALFCNFVLHFVLHSLKMCCILKKNISCIRILKHRKNLDFTGFYGKYAIIQGVADFPI